MTMLDWYFSTHSWNRIALTSLIVATIAKAIVGTLILEYMIALPIVAAVYWVLGWAALGGWNILQRRWRVRDNSQGRHSSLMRPSAPAIAAAAPSL
jgi:hypothetical protein